MLQTRSLPIKRLMHFTSINKFLTTDKSKQSSQVNISLTDAKYTIAANTDTVFPTAPSHSPLQVC